MQELNSMEQPTEMDPRLTTIQPGGGVVMSMELAWGRVRRRLLRMFRPGYVKAMASKRQGPFNPPPP